MTLPLFSIIIPTHNRAEMLMGCLKTIENLDDDCSFEVIVVGNNCTDHTEITCSEFSFVKYVEEPRTAFSKARRTGFESSHGEILVFLDDDARLWPGSLDAINEIFSNYPSCGLIAGRLEPAYEVDPPSWALELQQKKNAWSLLSLPPNEAGTLVRDLDSAYGPLIAVTRETYKSSGGFPPDTIGVETNVGGRQFSKWYVGPGDYGLSVQVRKLGLEVIYSADVGAYHFVSNFRMTPQFWFSRFYGEGFYLAVSDLMFWRETPTSIAWKALERLGKALVAMALEAMIFRPKATRQQIRKEQLDAIEQLSYCFMATMLLRHRNLGKLLWAMARDGVSDTDLDRSIANLPELFVLKAVPMEIRDEDVSSLVRKTFRYLFLSRR